MTTPLVLAIQVSFLLFLPLMLFLVAWLGNKAINLVGGYLERFNSELEKLVKLEKEQQVMLKAILNKLM